MKLDPLKYPRKVTQGYGRAARKVGTKVGTKIKNYVANRKAAHQAFKNRSSNKGYYNY